MFKKSLIVFVVLFNLSFIPNRYKNTRDFYEDQDLILIGRLVRVERLKEINENNGKQYEIYSYLGFIEIIKTIKNDTFKENELVCINLGGCVINKKDSRPYGLNLYNTQAPIELGIDSVYTFCLKKIENQNINKEVYNQKYNNQWKIVFDDVSKLSIFEPYRGNKSVYKTIFENNEFKIFFNNNYGDLRNFIKHLQSTDK